MFATSGEKLLYGVLSNIIPKEVLEWVQSGGLQKFIIGAGEKLKEMDATQQTILKQNEEILELLKNAPGSGTDAGNGDSGNSSEPLRVIAGSGAG